MAYIPKNHSKMNKGARHVVYILILQPREQEKRDYRKFVGRKKNQRKNYY